jgi:hypothetical protein
MGNLVRQSERHAAAFEFWVALGADRTHAEVARRFKVSVQSIHAWSRAFEWEKRLEEREKLVREITGQKLAEDEAQRRADALKITRAAILHFASTLVAVKNPQTGEVIKAATADIGASDFVQLAKLEQFLLGQPESRAELMIGGRAFERLMDALAGVIEREVQDPALRERLAIGFAKAAEVVAHA